MSSLPATRLLTVRQIDETPDRLTVRLTPPGWSALVCIALVLGGVVIWLVYGTGTLGLLGLLFGLGLAGLGLWGLYDFVGGRVRIDFDKRTGTMTAVARFWRRELPLADIRRVILAEIDRQRPRSRFRYELLLELNSGEVRPLTTEAGSPTTTEDERESYEALARRIHAFLGLAGPPDFRRTAGWPKTDPLPDPAQDRTGGSPLPGE